MGVQRIVPAAGAVGMRLRKGERLRIIDPHGGQSGDLIAFSADGGERLSTGRTFDYCGKIYVSTGDALWSDRSNPMLTIIADDVGRHDMLYAPCSLEMYKLQYGVTGYHPNCHDNLSAALRDLGIDPHPLTATLNFFMNVNVRADGALEIVAPNNRAGDAMMLRAEMDLAVAISACPASVCNGGAAPRSLAYEALA
jgi:uncharacterized protein